MRRFMFVLIALVSYFGILPATVLFSDDFNRANGAVGNSWTNISTATTSIENNAMKIISDNGKGIRRDFTAISSGIYYIQYDWKITSDDWYADAFPTGAVTHLIVDDAGNLCYDIDGSMSDPITMQPITFGTWNTVRLKVNIDTDRFSVWVNNTLVADNLAGTAVTSFTRFTFRAGLGAIVTQYVDNFVVYNDVAPAAPAGFTATGHVNDITLNWTPATETTYLTYKIYRSTTSPAATLLTEISGTLSQYVDTTALPNTSYFYRIKAVSMGTVESGFSAEVTAHRQPQAIITPSDITFNVGYGYSDSTSITISNTGSYPLVWNMTGAALNYNIPTNGLIAYYPLDGNGNDLSGNNRHGVINGLIPNNDRMGKANSAMLINSDDDYISIPDCNSSEISIAFWHYYNGTDGSCNSLLANRRNVPGNYNHLFTSPNNYIGDHPNTWNLSLYRLLPGSWYQITVLKSYNHMKLYINNTLVMDVYNSFNNAIAPLNIIGNVIYTGGEAAYGIWDNVFIYNRFLSENEVNSIYNYNPRLLTVSQDTGTLQVGDYSTLKLSLRAYEKEIGTYTDTLYVNSDDPANPRIPVIVHTTVLPPVPSITPSAFTYNINVANRIRTEALQVVNSGAGKMSYTLSGQNPYLSFAPASGNLLANSNTAATLTLTGTALTDGVYDTAVILSTNAPAPANSLQYPVRVNVDITPPLRVSSLTYNDALTDANQISFSWAANAVEDSVHHYKVFRKGKHDTAWTLLSTLGSNVHNYTDTAFTPLDSTFVYYKVSTVDWVENEGAASDSLMASLKRYLAPNNLAISTVNSRHIHLTWSPVTHTISGTVGTPSCYIIYKSDSPMPLSDFDFLGIATTPEFTHSWAAYFQPQNRLFYIVTAYGGDVSEARAMAASRRNWKYGALQGRLSSRAEY